MRKMDWHGMCVCVCVGKHCENYVLLPMKYIVVSYADYELLNEL